LIGKNGWRKIKNKKPKTTSRWASKQSRSGSITHTHSSTHISGVERECDGLFAVRLISSLRFTLFNERGKPAKPTYIVDSTRYMLYTYISYRNKNTTERDLALCLCVYIGNSFKVLHSLTAETQLLHYEKYQRNKRGTFNLMLHIIQGAKLYIHSLLNVLSCKPHFFLFCCLRNCMYRRFYSKY
jgi:hypothetical protein